MSTGSGHPSKRLVRRMAMKIARLERFVSDPESMLAARRDTLREALYNLAGDPQIAWKALAHARRTLDEEDNKAE